MNMLKLQKCLLKSKLITIMIDLKIHTVICPRSQNCSPSKEDGDTYQVSRASCEDSALPRSKNPGIFPGLSDLPHFLSFDTPILSLSKRREQPNQDVSTGCSESARGRHT